MSNDQGIDANGSSSTPNKTQPVTLLFFGSQGSGKGTQVSKIIGHLTTKSDTKVIRIDMGAELRAMVAEGGHTGPLVHAVINAGKRISDFMPIYLSTKRMVEEFTGVEHIIADGLARGEDQTRGFDDMMQFYGRGDYQIIHLTLSEDTAVKRLLARGRADDTEEAIRARLVWNKQIVEPQLELLRRRGKTVFDINGEQDAEAVHRDILSALKW
ncbi:nucleoside monophosphate kinase [Candidatus Kaiserbacteria bacterium]|nr:nucleoside monophosphate kinase [Candidatus Kaiserbacteria bacterium]